MKQVCLVLLLMLAAVGSLGAQSAKGSPEDEIRALLKVQAEAWNRGDIQAFMETYWKSPKTAYLGSRGAIRGWQSVLERYKRTYPDRRAMGKTTFSGLEITMLSPDSALVLGHWRLEREKEPLGGVFTLVVRKFPEGWRIIHDHTSAVSKSATQ